jgi:hypothetical protein
MSYKDPEKNRAKVKAWRKANPERVKAQKARHNQRPEVKAQKRLAANARRKKALALDPEKVHTKDHEAWDRKRKANPEKYRLQHAEHQRARRASHRVALLLLPSGLRLKLSTITVV